MGSFHEATDQALQHSRAVNNQRPLRTRSRCRRKSHRLRGFYVDREPASGELATPVTRDGLGLITESNDRALVRGMTLEAPASPPPDDLPVAVRPLPLTEDVEPDDAAQRVMQLMRTRHRLSWRDAKRFLPGCLPKSIASRQGSRYLIHEVQILHALGILELEEGFGGGLSALAELPPRMVLLPRLANRGYDDRFGAWKSPSSGSHGVLVAGPFERGKESCEEGRGLNSMSPHAREQPDSYPLTAQS